MDGNECKWSKHKNFLLYGTNSETYIIAAETNNGFIYIWFSGYSFVLFPDWLLVVSSTNNYEVTSENLNQLYSETRELIQSVSESIK